MKNQMAREASLFSNYVPRPLTAGIEMLML